MKEQEGGESTGDAQPKSGTSPNQGGGQGYPQVGKWETGIERGPANQVAVTKWGDIVGSKIQRGKANQLKEQPENIKKYLGIQQPKMASDATYVASRPNQIMIYPLNESEPLNLDSFIEKYREALYSPAGMAVELFLTSFGFTAPIVVGSYGALLSLDVYKAINGDVDWLNIIFDCLGLITSGALSGYLSKIVKKTPKFKKIGDAINWLSKTNIWKTIEPYLIKLGSLLQTILGWIMKGMSYVVKWTKSSWLGKFVNRIGEFLKPLFNFIESKTIKGTLELGATEKIASASGQSAREFAKQSAILGGFHLSIQGALKLKDAITDIINKNQNVQEPKYLIDLIKYNLNKNYPELVKSPDDIKIINKTDTKITLQVYNVEYLLEYKKINNKLKWVVTKL